MKPIFFFLALIISGCAHTTPSAPQPAWIFFDLGNTLVDTRDHHRNVKFLPEAEDYLLELKARGHRLGLISNVPVEWGKSTAERFAKLQGELEKEWIKDSREHHVAWNLFEPDGIFLPNVEAEMKPALTLFQAAMKRARADCADCPVIFQSESPKEVAAAQQAGMIGHLVDIATKDHRYYPVAKIPADREGGY